MKRKQCHVNATFAEFDIFKSRDWIFLKVFLIFTHFNEREPCWKNQHRPAGLCWFFQQVRYQVRAKFLERPGLKLSYLFYSSFLIILGQQSQIVATVSRCKLETWLSKLKSNLQVASISATDHDECLRWNKNKWHMCVEGDLATCPVFRQPVVVSVCLLNEVSSVHFLPLSSHCFLVPSHTHTHTHSSTSKVLSKYKINWIIELQCRYSESNTTWSVQGDPETTTTSAFISIYCESAVMSSKEESLEFFCDATTSGIQSQERDGEVPPLQKTDTMSIYRNHSWWWRSREAVGGEREDFKQSFIKSHVNNHVFYLHLHRK